MIKKKILLAEDDENFGVILQDFLELNDFEVVWCKDGDQALRKFSPNYFDLCVLDVMMPKKDGFTLAKEIKQQSEKQPIIFLTARGMKEDMLKGYKSGADDYITKPFDSELLLFKIEAILQRTSRVENPKQEVFRVGDYEFNSRFRILKHGDDERKLSPKEAALLHVLIQYKNDLLPRSVALQKVWKDDSYFAGRSMDVYVTKLRKMLKKDERIEIQNLHGEGFQLVVPT